MSFDGSSLIRNDGYLSTRFQNVYINPPINPSSKWLRNLSVYSSEGDQDYYWEDRQVKVLDEGIPLRRQETLQSSEDGKDEVFFGVSDREDPRVREMRILMEKNGALVPSEFQSLEDDLNISPRFSMKLGGKSEVVSNSKTFDASRLDQSSCHYGEESLDRKSLQFDLEGI